ncbi:MAG: alanine racemase [Cyclobacteriaceae bacterium]
MTSIADQITRPTLLVDKQKAVNNIRAMKAKSDKLGLTYRPHFKTHQSLEAGRWHKQAGITGITVSSVDMAAYFAAEWQDITIAFPANLREADAIDALNHKVKRLNLLAESPGAVRHLAGVLTKSVGVYLKIDTGYHRTGIAHSDHKKINSSLRAIKESEKLTFAGFLVHAGHTYDVSGRAAVEAIHREAIAALEVLERTYRQDHPDMIISYGDTPSASLMEDFGPVQELRPGNLVYYDVMQMYIGACTAEQIAVCMACPIVAVHAERNEIVVYGGAVHLSKDVVEQDGQKIYGLLADLTDNGWSAPVEGGYVRKLSQEHGVIRVPSGMLEIYRPGGLVGILPVHSCLAVDCVDDCYTLAGDRLDLF